MSNHRTPEARFNLRNRKNERDLVPVYLIYRFVRPSGEAVRVMYATGIKIKPREWDFDRQQAKVIKYRPDLVEINNRLLDLARLAKEVHASFRGDLDEATFKKHLKIRIDQKIAPQAAAAGLPDFIASYIQRYELDPERTEGTVKSLKRAAALIDRYAEDTGREIDFDLSVDEVIAFKAWLLEDRPGKKALEVNYAARMLGVVRQFLRAAYNEGKHGNRIFENTTALGLREIKKPKVALSADELAALYRMEPLEDEARERVRIMFLAECYSGLRFSDVRMIRPEHIRQVDGQRIIELTATKTKAPVSTPCPDELLSILERYDFQLPKLSQSEINLFNRRLKDIAKQAGLFRPVRVLSTVGGKIKDKFPKLYEVIASHTGRRTWATLRYMEDFSVSKIQKILGHATEKQTKEYIDMEHLDAAAAMAREMKRISRERERRDEGNNLKIVN